jgi:DNA-binding transcriptional ArsR family regulator
MSNQRDLAAELAFDALGDPMRRRIVQRLADGPRPVVDIATGLPIGRPAVSRHLKVLSDAGLVTHTSRGTRNLYALAPEGQVALQQWIVEMWGAALGSFAEYVEQQKGTGNEND